MRSIHFPCNAAISAVVLPLLSFPVSAQFEEGDNLIGVGVGVGGAYSVGFTGSGVSHAPAIALHFDHGMGSLGPGEWGLGGFLGYKRISYSERYFNYYNYDYSWTYLIIGARGTWHYNAWHDNDRLDTYGGVMLAYNAVTFNDDTDYDGYENTYHFSGSGIGVTGILGVRYFFTDNIGAYSELGYGVAVIQVGLAVKL